jgi:hypothetical protein
MAPAPSRLTGFPTCSLPRGKVLLASCLMLTGDR